MLFAVVRSEMSILEIQSLKSALDIPDRSFLKAAQKIGSVELLGELELKRPPRAGEVIVFLDREAQEETKFQIKYVDWNHYVDGHIVPVLFIEEFVSKSIEEFDRDVELLP